MTSRDFAYWLQGYFEVSQVKSIGETETQQIKNHLNLVFIHEIDPSIDKGNSDKRQEFNAIHNLGYPAQFQQTPLAPDGDVVARC